MGPELTVLKPPRIDNIILAMSQKGDHAFSLPDTLEILERTPTTLRVWLDGVSDTWLDQTEGGDTFSPRDVVGHLIHGEKTDWMPRLRQVMAGHGDRPFEPFDRFAMRDERAPAPIAALLNEFVRLREANLVALKQMDLTEADMQRTGIHPAIGKVTIEQLLATWTAHDLAHIAQIARTMAKRYSTAVGPWRSHLRVMDRK